MPSSCKTQDIIIAHLWVAPRIGQGDVAKTTCYEELNVGADFYLQEIQGMEEQGFDTTKEQVDKFRMGDIVQDKLFLQNGVLWVGYHWGNGAQSRSARLRNHKEQPSELCHWGPRSWCVYPGLQAVTWAQRCAPEPGAAATLLITSCRYPWPHWAQEVLCAGCTQVWGPPRPVVWRRLLSEVPAACQSDCVGPCPLPPHRHGIYEHSGSIMSPLCLGSSKQPRRVPELPEWGSAAWIRLLEGCTGFGPLRRPRQVPPSLPRAPSCSPFLISLALLASLLPVSPSASVSSSFSSSLSLPNISSHTPPVCFYLGPWLSPLTLHGSVCVLLLLQNSFPAGARLKKKKNSHEKIFITNILQRGIKSWIEVKINIPSL